MNDFVNDFKPHLYLINLRLFVISIFLNYASIILCYLDRTEFLFYLLKIFVQSSRNCVLGAVYSDCILKGLEAVSSCFVYKYTHLLAAQWTRNFQYCTRLRLVQYWKFLVHCAASACVYL